MATILIVEDHDILRWSLHAWLEFTFPWCKIIETGEAFQAKALALHYLPEVMIVDINLSNGGVFALVAQLKAAAPASNIVVMADYNDDIHRTHALASGASAYVYKRAILAQLQPVLTKILGVSNRATVSSPEIM